MDFYLHTFCQDLANRKNYDPGIQFTLSQNKSKTFRKMHLTTAIRIFIIFTCPLFLNGCFTASPDDDRMPQGRPASWEYSLPGGFDRGGFNR